MIHLYAEHLLNIRTLSIQATLSTISNKETNANLSSDGSILTLSHEGENASVKLPINLSPNQQSNIKLTIPAVPSKDLTFRIQIEEKDDVINSLLSNGAVTEKGPFTPWMADALSDDTEIHCRYCSIASEDGNHDQATNLLNRDVVKEWKNLPSEGWAEMMEFWHCHKPNEPHNHDHEAVGKGYAGGGQIAVQPGVGMVNTMELLVAREDSINVKPSDQQSQSDGNQYQSLVCAICMNTVGRIDSASQGYRLFKHHLAVSARHDIPPHWYTFEKWHACLILSATERQGVRKIVIRDSENTVATALKMWLFAPDLNVSSSAAESPDPLKVAKILWQDCEIGAHENDRLSRKVIAEGELTLSTDELAMFRDVLESSAVLLPEGTRNFQGWKVALLRSFTASDVLSP